MVKGSFAARRAALVSCALILASWANISAAQSAAPPLLPLTPTCTPTFGFTCPAPADGTTAVTVVTPITSTPNGDGTSTFIGQRQISYDGRLYVGGIVTSSSTNPFLSAALLQSQNSSGAVNVRGSTSYLETINARTVPFGGPPALVANPGMSYSLSSLALSQLDVNYDISDFEYANGDIGRYTLTTIDGTAITDNGTALTGSFTRTGTAIEFGTITGRASVSGTTGPVPFAEYLGTSAAVAPLVLSINTTETVTTRLDETGLVTPTVTVTDGIELNGSKITGLADGTAATDAVNRGQLDAEANARIAGDAALQAAVTTEAGLRASEDTAIRTALTTEATTRANADLQLNQRIATEEAARASLATSISAETAARIAADNALTTSINGLGTRVGALEARVGKIENKIDGSTAVAVAMGGSAFLPDMKFNLTGNVGTYGGEQAGSLQIGALVSDHVAVNAGVAKGFTKSGKTAGRVGFTFGW